jgi:hypothetical protein
MSFRSKFVAILAAAALGVSALAGSAAASPIEKNNDRASAQVQVNEPLDLAILIQDDVVSRVGNELGVTREFIKGLPAGSRVMVGYVRAGSLQVRQPFTEDLDKAAGSLRAPTGSANSAPYNPYVEVVEALKKFDESAQHKAILLISDGLDSSRGFDFGSTVESIDLDHAIREANKRSVAVYSFYAPTVGLTSFSRRAVTFGQSALNRLANETGGKAFFQGTSFVTFNAYFDQLRKQLNVKSSGA